ncbi:hypothetical protein [Thiohalorhabdus methylotrophus]|uniref:DUF2863 family protein n=1 Tax=Thiohalorhabdus methylotrophus TaxID=3242694 RepID=A0ABV4TXT9_9GAMM
MEGDAKEALAGRIRALTQAMDRGEDDAALRRVIRGAVAEEAAAQEGAAPQAQELLDALPSLKDRWTLQEEAIAAVTRTEPGEDGAAGTWLFGMGILDGGLLHHTALTLDNGTARALAEPARRALGLPESGASVVIAPLVFNYNVLADVRIDQWTSLGKALSEATDPEEAKLKHPEDRTEESSLGPLGLLLGAVSYIREPDFQTAAEGTEDIREEVQALLGNGQPVSGFLEAPMAMLMLGASERRVRLSLGSKSAREQHASRVVATAHAAEQVGADGETDHYRLSWLDGSDGIVEAEIWPLFPGEGAAPEAELEAALEAEGWTYELLEHEGGNPSCPKCGNLVAPQPGIGGMAEFVHFTPCDSES